MKKVIEKSKGYKSLLKSIKRDCKEGEGCFNPNGCSKQRHIYKKGGCYENTKCFQNYCDKFKWIINRVKHYSKKTGMSESNILNSWEERREYWYMNYYQEANQPLIKGDNVKIFDIREQFKDSLKGMGFRCPSCSHISKEYNQCDSNKCDWKSYGLFGTMGKGVTVFIKETLALCEIFMPVAWEKQKKKRDVKWKKKLN